MQERIKQIMADVFDVEQDGIKDDASPDTVSNWDSLRHMNLIESLEEEFAIEFTEDQIVEMMNYKLIQLIVSEAIGISA